MAVTINGSTGIEYDDNVKQIFGTGDDLEVYHDGTDSILKDTRNSGNLRLQADSIGLNDKDVSETMLLATADGSVDLYYNGTKTFQTTDEGAKIINGTSAAVLAVIGGEGTDSTIYQAADDGDDSADKWKMVASASGSNWTLYNAASGNWENSIKVIGDDAVELYFNNTKRFETNNYGAKVNGHLYLDDTHKVNLGSSQDLELYHDATNSVIKNNTGTLNILNDGTLQIKNNADNETIAQFVEGGACKFWYNTSQKFETTNDGCKIDGNLTLHTGTSSQIHFYDVDTHTITLYTSSTHFRWWSEVDGDAIAEIQQDGDMVIDGSYSTAGVDYAEYFESTDGSAIPIGTTVVLENGKVRAATDSETPIGVVRPKTNGTSITGGLNELKWQGKYLTDDYDDAVLEDATFCTWKEDEELKQAWKDSGETIPADATETPMKRRKLNPAFDKSKTYVPRSQRTEWNCVGLLGQIPITKGQPTATNWIKMKERSSTVELWMVK